MELILEIIQALQLNEECPVSAVEIGTIEILSGKIVASDPLVEPDAPAFDKITPKGSFPVQLLVDDHDEIAFAQIVFNNNPVVRVEMATLEGQSLDALEEGFIYGYPVDSGLGCFMDLEAGKLLTAANDELFDKDPESNYYDAVIDAELGENAHCDHRPSKDSKLNVLMFQTGWGDGVYASYWGFDAAGKIVTLVTDFGLVDLDVEEYDLDEE